MRLVVPFPAEWSTSDTAGGGRRGVVPGHAGEPDLFVDVSPVRPLPGALDAAFVQAEMGQDLPPGASLRVEGSRDDQSARGWPISLIRAQVVDGAGAIVEQRLGVLFRLLDNFATVLLRGKDEARWNQLAQSLGQVVLGAELDWSGPPACLAEILGVDASHPVFAKKA